MKTEKEANGLKVIVHNNDINRALRKLKKHMQSERVLQELQKHAYYEKPSAQRKARKAKARKRWLKKKSEIDRYL